MARIAWSVAMISTSQHASVRGSTVATPARGLVLSDWKAHVLDECYAMNGCFGAPIRSRRVRDCAYSVSVWTWERMIDYGRYRTPELQSRRGRKGGVARAERLSLRDSQWARHAPTPATGKNMSAATAPIHWG